MCTALKVNIVKQGFNLIFDSPCFYDQLLARGQQLAKEANAQYLYIECILEDLDELNRRLRKRNRHSSQVAGIRRSERESVGNERLIEESVFEDWIANMKRPEGEYLVLDTGQPLEISIKEAKQYVARKISPSS